MPTLRRRDRRMGREEACVLQVDRNAITIFIADVVAAKWLDAANREPRDLEVVQLTVRDRQVPEPSRVERPPGFVRAGIPDGDAQGAYSEVVAKQRVQRAGQATFWR